MSDEQQVGPLEVGFKFHQAAIRAADWFYLSTVSPRMQADGLPYTTFFDHDGDSFGLIRDVKWNCVSVCSPTFPKVQMVALGEYGQVLIFGADEEREERVTSEELEFREVREVAGKAYACAMDRKLFRRDGPDQWTPIHGHMPDEPGPDVVVGFESIHGISERDMYAVGWHGEIWHYNGLAWKQEGSPTSVLLNRVYCAPNGYVYACGLAGTLLRGKEGQWVQIAEDDAGIDLWDMAWFDNRLWVSSLSGLYTLEGDSLVPLEFDDDVPETCSRLDARDGILWSVGSDDIMQFDGETWSRIA